MLIRTMLFCAIAMTLVSCIDPPSGTDAGTVAFDQGRDAARTDVRSDSGPRDTGAPDGGQMRDQGDDVGDAADAAIRCDQGPCTTPRSCAEIGAATPEAPSGPYTIDPDGEGEAPPLEVHCDMISDGGVGYTMLRVEDPALQESTAAGDYVAACEAVGLEIAVPRSRGHALALVAYLGGPPNVIGVYPSEAGAAGLDNFEGRCQGEPCRFYVSDSVNNNASCGMANAQPDGTNNSTSPLYLWDTPTDDCPIGQFDDAVDYVRETGYVACSTNDVGPPTYGSCLQILEANSVQNTALYGINGIYTIEPQGSSAPVDIYCDFIRDGGGYGYLKVEVDREYSTPEVEQYCAELGMRLLVPRTAQHRNNASAVGREDAIGPSGATDYLELLGVYRMALGASCALQPMNSDNAGCEFEASDGGRFFVHDANTFSEPDGTQGAIDDSLEYQWGSDGTLTLIEDRAAGAPDTVRFICMVGDKPGP